MGYFDPVKLKDGSRSKPGMRGFPDLEPAQALMVQTLHDLDLGDLSTALDLTARGGAVALELARHGLTVRVFDDSAMAQNLLNGLCEVEPKLMPFHIENHPSADLSCLILPAERGNDRVRSRLGLALAQTKLGGRLLLAGEKDRGFERYFQEAISHAGSGEILERSKGWRVGLVEKKCTTNGAPIGPKFFEIQARGQTLQCVAHAGVFAAGKLDLASKLLLEHLPNATGHKVLDIGCGCGLLGGLMALEGADVTMLEDDRPSQQSSLETLRSNGLHAQVLHSDVDAALEPTANFDLIVSNPPFHVGSDLILDVALEFIACAKRRLKHGGEFWLVANHFLPYEAELGRIGQVREVARNHGFKVLMVRNA